MSVDSLTDSELRTKLAEYGYPVGPVTQTTRKILVKKLKNLMETRGGAGSRHSLAARYSSDETDEDTTSNSSRKKKPSASVRRQTMANPMPPPPVVAPAPVTSVPRSPGKRKAAPARNSEPKETPLVEYDEVPSSSSNRSITRTIQKKITTRTYKTTGTSDGLETGSDSDITEEPEKSYYSNKSYDSRARDRSSADIEHSTKLYESRGKPSTIAPKTDKYVVPPFKPNISPILPVREESSYKKDDLSVNDILANYETPYLSEFTRRLSSRSSINPAPARSTLKSPVLRSTVTETKDGDTNGHFSLVRPSYTTGSSSSRYSGGSSIDRPRDVVSRTFKSSTSSKEEVRNNQNMISMVLVIVLALFFGVLAVMYLGLGGKTESSLSFPTDSDLPYCHKSDHIPAVNCVLKEHLENVIDLLHRIRPILMQKAVAAVCEDNADAPYLTDSEIINMFKSNTVKEREITSDLHNAQLLIFGNPKWGISLVEIGDGNDMPYQLLDTMDKVFQTRLETKVGMIIKNPELPMKCFIKQKLFAIFSLLLLIAIGAAVVLGGHRLVLWYLKHKKSAEREIFQLVSEIINMVEVHHQNACTTSPGGTQESYLAINHVRDNLIPPKDRKKMAGLWEKAVKFLDENESRIRREVQQVAGEEFHVWRWLPNNILNTSNPRTPAANKKAKVWQGQAFDTKEGSVNTLTSSPTPCLKIRHMFDPDVEFEENWETKVQDAILEKCGEGVKILHIRVDRGSREGCVYMKCMSQEDAGKAYRAVHGCWFDGNLVTVKYLRLERYHERFPDAIRCTAPLKPSNNQRLSMQAHSWQSSLEAN